MKLNLHKKFLDALANLSTKEQERVRSTISQILHESDVNGLRLHKVGQFWSYSASLSLRLIAWREGESVFLLHVDQHDNAYRWAERNTAVLSNTGNFIGLIDIEYSNNIITTVDSEASDDTLNDRVKQLVSIGLSLGFSQYLDGLNDDEILDAILLVTPEYQESILQIFTGSYEDINTDMIASDIYPIDDDQTLRFALSFSESKWRMFLHPKQKFAVDMPIDRHIILRGGPGTGKTVTIIHRFMRLHRECSNSVKKPVLLVVNKITRDIVLSHISEFGERDMEKFVVSIEEFGRGQTNLVNKLNAYSAVLVDEGQDFPVSYLAKMLELLESDPDSVPPHFIAFDGNQAIISPSGEAIVKFQLYCDVITLRYSYRATRENITASLAVLKYLHDNCVGKDFQHSYRIGASRDITTKGYVTGLTGPRVSFAKFQSKPQLQYLLQEAFQYFDERYSIGYTKAVILVGDAQNIQSYTEGLQQIIDAEFLNPIESKGREYFAGVVIDLCNYASVDDDKRLVVTSAMYKTLSGLYVAITRFRDRVKVFYSNAASPFAYLEKHDGNTKESN
jgi:hypothetical protein